MLATLLTFIGCRRRASELLISGTSSSWEEVRISTGLDARLCQPGTHPSIPLTAAFSGAPYPDRGPWGRPFPVRTVYHLSPGHDGERWAPARHRVPPCRAELVPTLPFLCRLQNRVIIFPFSIYELWGISELPYDGYSHFVMAIPRVGGPLAVPALQSSPLPLLQRRAVSETLHTQGDGPLPSDWNCPSTCTYITLAQQLRGHLGKRPDPGLVDELPLTAPSATLLQLPLATWHRKAP